MMTSFQVDDPMFKTAPLFIMGCDFEEFRRYMRKHFKRIDVGLNTGQAGQMFTFDCPPWRVVWVKNRPDNTQRLGVLLHEIFHLVTRVCQDKGIPIKAQIDEGNGDEAAAYLFDYFAREAFKRSSVRLMRRNAS